MAPLTFTEEASLGPDLEPLARALGRRPWSDQFYLAGANALRLFIRHRQGRGLDLMSAGNRLTPQKRRDLLRDLLEMDPGIRVETARDGYLYVRTGRGAGSSVGVKLYYYPYPLVDPELEIEGLEVASAVDLGLMKLGAVISRGARRDFIDLFLLCRRLPLAYLLERSPEKFGHVRDFPLQALKGLSDLSLISGEPMPRLETPVSWDEVESWLRSEVRVLGRRAAGLPVQASPTA